MSIKVFRGGRVPQSGGRFLPSSIGRPNVFFPNNQVGYGIGGVLKPLARTVFAAVKGQAKKLPGYLGKIAKKHGKRAAQQLITGVIAGKFKKGQRKKAVKRIAASNLQKAKKNIQKDIQKAVIKSISRPKRKMTTKKTKPSRKRKGFSLKYRTKPGKRRRKDIFDK